MRKTTKAKQPLPIVGEPVRKPSGYVVRYQSHDEQTMPLELNYEYGGILMIDGNAGTIFQNFDLAYSAAWESVKYQRKNNLVWNEMYGPYVITPAYL